MVDVDTYQRSSGVKRIDIDTYHRQLSMPPDVDTYQHLPKDLGQWAPEPNRLPWSQSTPCRVLHTRRRTPSRQPSRSSQRRARMSRRRWLKSWDQARPLPSYIRTWRNLSERRALVLGNRRDKRIAGDKVGRRQP